MKGRAVIDARLKDLRMLRAMPLALTTSGPMSRHAVAVTESFGIELAVKSNNERTMRYLGSLNERHAAAYRAGEGEGHGHRAAWPSAGYAGAIDLQVCFWKFKRPV